LYSFLSSPMLATFPSQLILIDLICLMIYGDEYKIWSFSLCNLLYSPVTLPLLRLKLNIYQEQL
jgi:hypothetical protein